MKFANGTGSITKLKGKRRKPFLVRSPEICVVEDGKPKRKRQIIGYTATHKEALMLLSEYVQNPYDLNHYTVTQVWEKAYPRMKVKEKRLKELKSIFNTYLLPIKDMNIREVKTEDLQSIIDNCEKRSGTKNNIKTVMHTIYDYALANDITHKDYSQFIKYDRDDVLMERELFPIEQINKMWEQQDTWQYAFILILLYTGCRFVEISDNKIENLDLENKTLYIPEEVAKNKPSIRTIPLHDKIIPLIKKYLGETYLFEHDGFKADYHNMYARDLPKINKFLNSNHTFHDTRHTFTTELKERKVDLFYIDELVGHKHNNITEDVYTHPSMESLREALNHLEY